MSLQDIERAFVSAAEAEWAKIKAEGIIIEQEIVADAKSTFESLAEQFAPLVMSTISSLAVGELNKLSGSEKTNLAATTVVDQAAQKGITILAADATALIKNGFEAFKNAAPAIVPPSLESAVEGAIDGVAEKVEGAVEGAVDAASKAV